MGIAASCCACVAVAEEPAPWAEGATGGTMLWMSFPEKALKTFTVPSPQALDVNLRIVTGGKEFVLRVIL